MKQSYHTDLLIQLRLNLLSDDIRKTIPKSTLSSWNNRNLSNIVGIDCTFTDEKLELIKRGKSNTKVQKNSFFRFVFTFSSEKLFKN